MSSPKKADLPKQFSQRMQFQLENEYDAFSTVLDSVPPVSIHIHPIKGDTDLIDLKLTRRVPWCKSGYYLDQRPVFTLDPAFHAGAYYVQEASSMIIDYVVRELISSTDIKILDLCAAPGGKSTLISSILNGEGLLVSNETISSRTPALIHNLIKWGYANQIVTCSDPERFKSLKNYFDLILIDAPCSGEGLFRKDPESRKEWSEHNVFQCVLRQKRILDAAQHSVKPGGYLVYSTCTYNPDENSNQLRDLVLTEWECVRLNKIKEWNFTEISKNDSIGYQAYPHKVEGEGFFISVLKKPGKEDQKSLLQGNSLNWIKKPSMLEEYLPSIPAFDFFEHNQRIHFFSKEYARDLEIISHYLRIVGAGCATGEFKGDDFIPDHALSQSIYLTPEFRHKQLSKTEAINYLKRVPPPNSVEQRGYLISKYNKHNLGWLKGIQGRFNNLYPSEYRIKSNFSK